MKYGFMLIELIIATLIASMIGSLLLTALYQGGRSQAAIDTMFETSVRVGIVTGQLEKDFMGAFVPVQARIKDEKEEDEESSTAKPPASKSTEKKPVSTDKDSKEEKVSKPAEKPLEKIFYSINKGTRLDHVTFITNNPLAVFVGKDVGVVKPKVVRVQYTLKAEDEKQKKDTFTLFRQEGTELDLSKFGSVRSYEVISGIKDFAITYTSRIEKKQDKKPQSAQNIEKPAAKKGPEKRPPVVYEYTTSKEWVSELKQEENKSSDKQEQEPPRIPHFVEIKMVLWNLKHSQEEEFIISFELPVDTSSEKKEEDSKDDKKKAPTKMPPSPDASTQALNKDELIDTLTVTLGNLTKIFGKS